MSKKQSITAYLAKRIGALFILFVLVWTLVAKWVYHYAWDDTTEFYLHQDLELALSGQLALPYHFEGKYIGALDQMPTEYRLAVESTEIMFAHTALFAIQSGDMYILKAQGVDEEPLYVVHFFSVQDSPSLMPIFIILAGAMLLPLGFVIWRIGAHVSKEADNVLESVANQVIKPSQFSEFDQFATVYKTAQFAQQHALDQERLFAAFLSHEIRTPLTKISLCMSRIQQIDDIPLEALDVLDTLEVSQRELSQIAQGILLLSRPNSSQLQNHALNNVLKRWRIKWHEHGLIIELQIEEHQIIQAVHTVLFSLMLTQVAKNALQHGQGALDVYASDQGLRFENSVGGNHPSSGFGLGSKIIKQVCDCFGWYVKSTVHGERYVLEVIF
ncbi:HAMP domain-containing histidine kinase [Pseudoalteromonas luteoviolacea]|uniref:ATP-binding protein n=1 Tax=Pseudoalteromonas luteoviolacea TaxID=43657 RepID=UPI001B36A909|nr:HAMP domain-containing sensor histidine kinase [Pseudoalteromonas luteoviolacea]MBQ4811617.1 HAMP domain-containing histidine kinase [Pseudoalteromonas luteoviolacea]